ncbi:MAG: DNA-directed RNA polymerase subunit omega [Verrucomicrobiota bacterium]
MRHTYVQEALKQIKSPEILVNIISRRCRQLGQGARPLVEVHPKWTFMDVALREVAEGKLSYELITEEESEKTTTRKPRRRRSS